MRFDEIAPATRQEKKIEKSVVAQSLKKWKELLPSIISKNPRLRNDPNLYSLGFAQFLGNMLKVNSIKDPALSAPLRYYFRQQNASGKGYEGLPKIDTFPNDAVLVNTIRLAYRQYLNKANVGKEQPAPGQPAATPQQATAPQAAAPATNPAAPPPPGQAPMAPRVQQTPQSGGVPPAGAKVNYVGKTYTWANNAWRAGAEPPLTGSDAQAATQLYWNPEQ